MTRKIAVATAAVVLLVVGSAAGKPVTRTVAFSDKGRLKITVSKVVDPLMPADPNDEFVSRPPRDGRYVGVMLRVANISKQPYQADLFGHDQLFSAERPRRPLKGWSLIGYGCDDVLGNTILPRTVARGCMSWQVPSEERPARLVLVDALDRVVTWQF